MHVHIFIKVFFPAKEVTLCYNNFLLVDTIFTMSGLNYHLIKVLYIEEKTFISKQSNSDQPKETPYKKVHVLEELGWWMEAYYINVFQNHAPYDSLSLGDKLYLWVSI